MMIKSLTKKTLYLQIAGFNIRLNFKRTRYTQYLRKKLKEEILAGWKSFMFNREIKRVDFTIDFVEENRLIVFTNKKNKMKFIGFYKEVNAKRITTFYGISILYFQFILRKILEKLLVKKGLLLHASASNFKGKALVFLGKTNSGKSTVMSFLHPKYSSLGDDSIIIKKENQEFYFYQTPFWEKNRVVKKRNDYYPLGKIFFLRKANFFKIKKLNNKNYILKTLINQFYVQAKSQIKENIPLLIEFVHKIDDFYVFYFAKDRQKTVQLFDSYKNAQKDI